MVEPRLVELDALPPGLIDCDVRELGRVLSGPTLIHLAGRDPRPLFVSVSLHGNETTGFAAVQRVLAQHAGHLLPRALSLFVGNVEAAVAGVRTLPGQPDYNRVWPGTPTPELAEARLVAEVVAKMRARQPFASIDIHNNTGTNPHYACTTRTDAPFLHLAALFGRMAVLYELPLGSQTAAFSDFCPAVTVECGRVGTNDGVRHAAEYLEACLHLSAFPQHTPAPHDLELLRTVVIVRVPPAFSMTFEAGATDADMCFRPDIDRLNFSECPPGTSFGRIRSAGIWLELLPGEGDADVGEWFDYHDGEIRLARTCIPAMLTLDVAAVRLDCLCYLMQPVERVQLQHALA